MTSLGLLETLVFGALGEGLWINLMLHYLEQAGDLKSFAVTCEDGLCMLHIILLLH